MSLISLATRMRPVSLDEVIGQPHLTDPGSSFRRAVDSAAPPSILLWGPPGCGKTTVARLISGDKFRMVTLSAVTDGIPQLREILKSTETTPLGLESLPTLLFVDEIHRWNKAQQDALLPHVEDGRIHLVGATTENPSFNIIPALRSRCWVIQLNPLKPEDLVALLNKALTDPRGLNTQSLQLDDEAALQIAALASGDARRALSILDQAAQTTTTDHIDLALLEQLNRNNDLGHSPTGDDHYDIVSAFIKSMRGSDPDAALYWMARLIEAGEDPTYIARRMVIFASEDIGTADPRGLPLAVAAMQAIQRIGMPEARITLGHACCYLATAPKSNASYLAIGKAIEKVQSTGRLPVPTHLTAAGKNDGYQYPHDHPHHIVDQQYMPDALADVDFYLPTDIGSEKMIGERLAWWTKQKKS